MIKEVPQNACHSCGEMGRIVARQTVVHHVKSEKLAEVKSDEYKFCLSESCSTVYYSVSGEIFTVDDIRELVTSKTKGDNRPLCYCFGFTEGFARQEIAQTGESSVPAQVTEFIKEKLCACEIRNPSSVCCLGEINKTVKRLKALMFVEANKQEEAYV
jgi:hypothetical protein